MNLLALLASIAASCGARIFAVSSPLMLFGAIMSSRLATVALAFSLYSAASNVPKLMLCTTLVPIGVVAMLGRRVEVASAVLIGSCLATLLLLVALRWKETRRLERPLDMSELEASAVEMDEEESDASRHVALLIMLGVSMAVGSVFSSWQYFGGEAIDSGVYVVVEFLDG